MLLFGQTMGLLYHHFEFFFERPNADGCRLCGEPLGSWWARRPEDAPGRSRPWGYGTRALRHGDATEGLYEPLFFAKSHTIDSNLPSWHGKAGRMQPDQVSKQNVKDRCKDMLCMDLYVVFTRRAPGVTFELPLMES